ncbi:hypothetical protein P8971_23515 [Serratia marcescens]|uniref:heparin lyase I family protein n=1 Tax=Serratia marcescens TaxID=615 RepID=UPI003204B34D
MKLPPDFLTWIGTTSPLDGVSHSLEKKHDETFYTFESPEQGRLKVVFDNERGYVWEFNKPATPDKEDDYRCEANGIISRQTRYSWVDSGSYHFSWSSKLSSTMNVNGRPFVIFQWKSYSGGIQNYPFLIRVNDGVLEFIHVTESGNGSSEGGDWIFFWSHRIDSNEWFDISFDVFLSKRRGQGKIKLTFNGLPQMFTKDQYNNNIPETEYFICRTLDNNGNTPKWGFYNRGVPQHALTHWIDRLFIKQTGMSVESPQWCGNPMSEVNAGVNVTGLQKVDEAISSDRNLQNSSIAKPQAADNFLYWIGTTTPNIPGTLDEHKPPEEIFRGVEIGENTGASVKVVQDPERGKVWLYDKPAHSTNYRCESNSIRLPAGSLYEGWEAGQSYDFSWSSKFPEVENSPHGDYVIFQWKSQGDNVYPFFMKVQSNRLEMTHYNLVTGGHHLVWHMAIEKDRWYDIRIRTLLSYEEREGRVELYINEVQQEFHSDREGNQNRSKTLACQTFSPDRHYLKWGVYNTGHPENALRHYVDKLTVKRIA